MPAVTGAQAQTNPNVAVTDPLSQTVKAPKAPKEPRSVWRPEQRDDRGNLTTKIKGKDTADFDPKTHQPLKKVDFENPADYLEIMADRMEAKVARLRTKAADERSLGTVKDRTKARQFKALHKKFATLEKDLRESGMSDQAIASLLAG